MSAVIHTVGDGSSSLSTDSNPNSSEPDAGRKFDSPFPSTPINEAVLYVVAKGGTSVSVKVWVYDDTMGRWFSKGSAIALSADQVVIVGDVPRGVKLTLQVTLNLGVTMLGAGFMGDSA